jgi:DNA-binding HxlR family transcriptional regulator
MDKYPKSYAQRERELAEKLRKEYEEPRKWERSPKVDFPALAVTNSDKYEIVRELSRGPRSTPELLELLPRISARRMSDHLNYLAEAGWVSWRRLPKKATKVWTVDAGLLADVIDTAMQLDAPRYERHLARMAAKRDRE